MLSTKVQTKRSKDSSRSFDAYAGVFVCNGVAHPAGESMVCTAGVFVCNGVAHPAGESMLARQVYLCVMESPTLRASPCWHGTDNGTERLRTATTGHGKN